MNPRTGRPPKGDSRSNRIITRMSPDETEKLDYCCETTGKSRSEIIREGIDKIYQELREQEQVN